MTIKTFLHKINNRWKKLRFQPIRVFCFHQISEIYDDSIYCKPDWIPASFLKDYIYQLQERGYHFISLPEAHQHLCRDWFRFKRYAVLTADDGLKCQLDLLPWLKEQRIPITFFLNVKSVNGNYCGLPIRNWLNLHTHKEIQEEASKLYFTKFDMNMRQTEKVYIGLHGVEHESPITEMSPEKFLDDVRQCVNEFNKDPRFIPFYAYVYGAHNEKSNLILKNNNIIPVYADGAKNYNDGSCIHRELLEVEYKKWRQKF